MNEPAVSTSPASDAQGAVAGNMGRGLRCLAVLNEWERVHMPFIKSTSGRDLYFLIVKHFLLSANPLASIPLKSFTVDLTDKAMRRRMQEFQGLDLLAIESRTSDARSKTVRPTDKLRTLFDAHTMAMRGCFKHYFYYIKKDHVLPLSAVSELQPAAPDGM